jgi:hypothetical protein
MIEKPESPPPDGREEPESVDVGEPESGQERSERRDDRRPNLDEREENISTRRKPMGPPLGKPGDRPGEDREDREDRDEGPAPEPVDPA